MPRAARVVLREAEVTFHNAVSRLCSCHDDDDCNSWLAIDNVNHCIGVCFFFSFTVTAGMAIETKAIVKGRKAKRRSLLVKYIF